MIPKILHQVWPGSDEIPEQLMEYHESWSKNNPEWEMKIWDESNLPEFVNQDLYDHAKNFGVRSDLARIELLCMFGGVYADFDVECYKPFYTLIDGLSHFFVLEKINPDKVQYANCIFGAEKAHPIFIYLRNGLQESFKKYSRKRAYHKAGPHYVNRKLEDLKSHGWKINSLPTELIFPYPHWRRGIKAAFANYPNAFTAHHWWGRWMDTRRKKRGLEFCKPIACGDRRFKEKNKNCWRREQVGEEKKETDLW